jgi:hypothetical protein
VFVEAAWVPEVDEFGQRAGGRVSDELARVDDLARALQLLVEADRVAAIGVAAPAEPRALGEAGEGWQVPDRLAAAGRVGKGWALAADEQ